MKRDKRNLAYHFVGKTLRDGRPIPADGEWLEYSGVLKMCRSGLHFFKQPFDALQYAPGETLCLVEYGGIIEHGDDKGICTRRKIIARMDATELLYYFARLQAISSLDKWDMEPPQVVLDYLMGDDEQRSAAYRAARSAAYSAARSAAYIAAYSAARSASQSAAYAAESAAYSAVRELFNSLVFECFEDFL